MMTPQKFAYALGKVESNNTPYGKFGDSGRAMGQWQLHPDARDTDARLLNIVANLGETWDSYVYRIVIAFYNHYTALGYSPPEVAMIWHLGHAIHEGGAGWDTAYNDRFLIAAGWVASRSRLNWRANIMGGQMNGQTVFWTAIAFLSGYASVMATLPNPTGVTAYFSWVAVSAGLVSLVNYHIGKGQTQGGVFAKAP